MRILENILLTLDEAKMEFLELYISFNFFVNSIEFFALYFGLKLLIFFLRPDLLKCCYSLVLEPLGNNLCFSLVNVI